MKFLTILVIAFTLETYSSYAQDHMSVYKEAQDIAMKLDRVSGKMELINIEKNIVITKQYEIDYLELDIYDAQGDYAGSLELNGYLIPKNEVDRSEKVKISNFRFRNVETGELLMLINVDFIL